MKPKSHPRDPWAIETDSAGAWVLVHYDQEGKRQEIGEPFYLWRLKMQEDCRELDARREALQAKRGKA